MSVFSTLPYSSSRNNGPMTHPCKNNKDFFITGSTAKVAAEVLISSADTVCFGL